MHEDHAIGPPLSIETAPAEPEGLGLLREALERGVKTGRTASLERWFEGQLGPDGVPRRLPVVAWGRCLSLLTAARRSLAEQWPELFDARIEGLFRALLRFSRPDGTTALGPWGAAAPADRQLFREWAERLPDPGLATVVDWWFPSRSRSRGRAARHAPPPLPAWSSPDRPLAMLRANWRKDGDFLALDHRDRGASGAVELFGLGRSWIGPTWTSGTGDAPATRARPTFWLSHPSADVAEWTFWVGEARITRTAVLLRGRRLALLAEQVEGRPATHSMRLSLAAGVHTGTIAESRGLSLTIPRRRPSARVFPLGLPRLPYATDRGSFSSDGAGLTLCQRMEGRRCWLPLVVSWDPDRNRLPVHWRTLTVSEQSRACPAETACAARISWGRDETLLIYRSLARPALRTVLGHQTRARFLIGLFDAKGDVQPILKVDG